MGKDKKDKTKSPDKKKSKKVSVTPSEEEEPNLFASIGAMVNQGGTRPRSSASTVGTAKYPGKQGGAPIMASSNANEATRRANEMANAMAWLTNPAAASASEEEPNAGADLFGDAGNWWESEFDVEADDD